MSGGADNLTPAERRLLDYVDQLCRRDLRAGEGLATAVLRTTRWQAAARPYLTTAGVLAAAAGTGVQRLLGTARRA